MRSFGLTKTCLLNTANSHKKSFVFYYLKLDSTGFPVGTARRTRSTWGVQQIPKADTGTGRRLASPFRGRARDNLKNWRLEDRLNRPYVRRGQRQAPADHRHADGS